MTTTEREKPKPAWLRPRWIAWVTALALIGAVYWFTPSLVLKGVVAPATSPDRPGWSALRTNPAAPREDAAPAVFPPDRRLATGRGSALTAYGLWFAPRAGVYTLNMYVRGACELGLDGRRLLSLEGDVSGQTRLELGAGPHLLRVSLRPQPNSDGSCRLEMFGRDDPAQDLIAGGDLRAPDLAGAAAGWEIASLAKNAQLSVALAYAATALLILLPLCLPGGWLSLVAAGLVIFIPAFALPGPAGRTPFIGGPQINRLQAEKPDFVVIGNSYADCGIDGPLLGGLTGGKVEKLIYPGSETTIHYLMFKNILAASGVRPKTTFIFTTDNSLTNPHLMVFPGAFQTLCPEGGDPLVDELVFGGRPWLESLRRRLDDLFRVRAFREEMGGLVPAAALELTGLTIPLVSPGQLHALRGRANHRFDLDRLRARANLATAGDRDRWDDEHDRGLYLEFDKVVETSFLPHLIALARERQLRLVFVRIQRKPPPDGPLPQDPRLVRYIDDLRVYLQGQGVGFHDFTGDPELTADRYMADDHIADTDHFTRLFFRRLAWALP